jgi:hypothetical protein
MFANDLDEFDDSKETVVALSEEYKAAENESYIRWGEDPSGMGGGEIQEGADPREPPRSRGGDARLDM